MGQGDYDHRETEGTTPTETDERGGGSMPTKTTNGGSMPMAKRDQVGGVHPQGQPMGGVHPQFTKTEQRQGGESTPTQFHKEIDRGYDANGDGWHGDELDDVTVRVPCPYVWTYIMVARIP